VGQLAGSLDVNVDYNDGWREHSRVEKQAATGTVQYFLEDASILKLRVDFVHDHSNLPGSLDAALFFSNPKQSNNTFGYDRIDRITPTLTYDRKIGDSGKLNLAFQVQSNTSENAIDPDNFRYINAKYEGIVSYRSSLDLDMKARYSHELKGLLSRITGGADFTHSDQQSDSSTMSLQPTTPQPVARFTSYGNQTKNDSYDVSVNAVAPYLQLESSPVERLRLLAGGRYDAIMYDATGKNSHSVSGSRDFNEATFRVGAIYDIVKELNVFANYTQGFLAPGAEQLYTAPSYHTAAGLKSAANGTLNPEKAQGCEVGLRSSFWEKRARFDVSYYDMTVRDKIVRNSTETNSLNALYSYQNAARTSNRGVELLASVTPVEMLRLTVAYTHSRNVYDEYNGMNVNGNLLPRAPKNHLNARLALLPVKGLEVELEVDEVTRQYADDANTMAYSRPTLVNLRARYDLQSWSFWAHLLNVTNQSYASYVTQSTTATTPTASYYPGEPLTFYLGASYKWN
jgi:iron complex outermembrane recepter protein